MIYHIFLTDDSLNQRTHTKKKPQEKFKLLIALNDIFFVFFRLNFIVVRPAIIYGKADRQGLSE